MVTLSPTTHERPLAALVYAWSGVAVMWGFWISFVIFLAEPRALMSWWPLPTIDRPGSAPHSLVAAIVDLGLVVLFGLQHSVMARPWFKERVMRRMPGPFERCTYVHMANLALFTLILLWQPIPFDVWRVDHKLPQQVLGVLFAGGWIILFFGAWSSESVSCWAWSRCAPGRKDGRLRAHASRPVVYIGGCGIPCMWACCSASGRRRA
jgi:hypothetical protein